MSVCLKQHGLESALQLLGHSASGDSEGEETAEEQSSLLDAVFTRINGLERRLQVRMYCVVMNAEYYVRMWSMICTVIIMSVGLSAIRQTLYLDCVHLYA